MNKKLSDLGDVIDYGSHQAYPCDYAGTKPTYGFELPKGPAL